MFILMRVLLVFPKRSTCIRLDDHCYVVNIALQLDKPRETRFVVIQFRDAEASSGVDLWIGGLIPRDHEFVPDNGGVSKL